MVELSAQVAPQAVFDVAVVGAGFGGLATALRCAELGAKVLLIERLNYPGGCASTFSRNGLKLEAGATLFSGFGPGHLFNRWIKQHALDVQVTTPHPLVRFRSQHTALEIGSDREAFIASLCGLYPESTAELKRFFVWQEKIAGLLWQLFEDPRLLPPFGMSALWTHMVRSPTYFPLLLIAGKSLLQVMERFSVAHLKGLRDYADAVSQITVQASAAQAEAPFALATMDYYFRGTAHVVGGIGVLANALTQAVAKLGGEVRLGERVTTVSAPPEHGGVYRITSSKGSYLAKRVALNLTPTVASEVLEVPNHPLLRKLAERVDDGWGAVMWYFALPSDVEQVLPHAHHVELVADAAQPFCEGNHVFCSISDVKETLRAPDGLRTVTMSTHLALSRLRGLDKQQRAELVQSVQDRMWATLQLRAPEIAKHAEQKMPASPRTFERFTGRQAGAVGGIPRRVGLHHYFRMGLVEPMKGVWLVGDSVGLGQSTLATALTGLKVAERMCR